jgi:hypothetical protein
MSRTYQQHPELFPCIRESDPYYGDHLRDSRVNKMTPSERKELFRGTNYIMKIEDKNNENPSNK